MIDGAIFFLFLFILYFLLIITYAIGSINKKNINLKLKNKNINRIRNNINVAINNVNRGNKRKIYKLFKRRYNLLLFNEILFEDEKLYRSFVKQYVDIFNKLSLYYIKKDGVTRTFYAYCLGLYELKNQVSYIFLFDVLKRNYSEGLNNAFNTICIYGEIDQVLLALNVINNRRRGINADLIAMFLLRYGSDKKELANALKIQFDSYCLNLQRAIVKYFVNFKFDNSEEFIKMLKRRNTPRNLKLEIIKYFKVITNSDIKKLLFKMLDNVTDVNLTVAIIDTLSSYSGADIIEVLKKMANNSNYQVKYQAINSLIKFLDIDAIKKILSEDSLEILACIQERGNII